MATTLASSIDPTAYREPPLSPGGDTGSETPPPPTPTGNEINCHRLAMQGEELSKQGDYGEAIPVLEAALEAGCDDSQLTSVLWSLLGNAHFYQGDYDTAITCHSHDLAICCESNDEKSKAQAYCNLGIAHRKSGYLQKAKLCYESYLELCELLEDRRSISKANHNLGDLHLTLGRLKLQKDGGLESSPEGRDHLAMAAMYYEKHLEFIQDHGSKASECRAHGNLGVIYELLQNTDKAIDHHQKRLDIATEINDKANIGRSYCSIGNCLRAILQPDKAMECYKRGLTLASELDDQTGLGVCHHNMATTYELLGSAEETADQHEKQYQAMKNAGNIQGQILALTSLAKIYETLANASRAIESLEKLVYLHRELKEETEMKTALADITRLGGSERGDTLISPPSPSPPYSTSASINSLPGSSKDSTTNGGGSSKKGGIFKKLKEKRLKKRSVIGPETSTSVSRVIGTGAESWRPSSPLVKEDKKAPFGANKKSTSSSSKEKLNLIKLSSTSSDHNSGSPLVQKRSDSVSSQDAFIESNRGTEGSPKGDRKRAWSHGHINKVSTDVQPPNNGGKSNNNNKNSPQITDSSLTFSNSMTFSNDPNNIHLANFNEVGGATEETSSDRYMIHGPISADGFTPLLEEGTPTYIAPPKKKELYDSFGETSHRDILRELEEFLATVEESEPIDLNILEDWDGWMIGSLDIKIQSTKESKLI